MLFFEKRLCWQMGGGETRTSASLEDSMKKAKEEAKAEQEAEAERVEVKGRSIAEMRQEQRARMKNLAKNVEASKPASPVAPATPSVLDTGATSVMTPVSLGDANLANDVANPDNKKDVNGDVHDKIDGLFNSSLVTPPTPPKAPIPPKTLKAPTSPVSKPSDSSTPVVAPIIPIASSRSLTQPEAPSAPASKSKTPRITPINAPTAPETPAAPVAPDKPKLQTIENLPTQAVVLCPIDVMAEKQKQEGRNKNLPDPELLEKGRNIESSADSSLEGSGINKHKEKTLQNGAVAICKKSIKKLEISSEEEKKKGTYVPTDSDKLADSLGKKEEESLKTKNKDLSVLAENAKDNVKNLKKEQAELKKPPNNIPAKKERSIEVNAKIQFNKELENKAIKAIKENEQALEKVKAGKADVHDLFLKHSTDEQKAKWVKRGEEKKLFTSSILYKTNDVSATTEAFVLAKKMRKRRIKGEPLTKEEEQSVELEQKYGNLSKEEKQFIKTENFTSYLGTYFENNKNSFITANNEIKSDNKSGDVMSVAIAGLSPEENKNYEDLVRKLHIPGKGDEYPTVSRDTVEGEEVLTVHFDGGVNVRLPYSKDNKDYVVIVGGKTIAESENPESIERPTEQFIASRVIGALGLSKLFPSDGKKLNFVSMCLRSGGNPKLQTPQKYKQDEKLFSPNQVFATVAQYLKVIGGVPYPSNYLDANSASSVSVISQNDESKFYDSAKTNFRKLGMLKGDKIDFSELGIFQRLASFIGPDISTLHNRSDLIAYLEDKNDSRINISSDGDNKTIALSNGNVGEKVSFKTEKSGGSYSFNKAIA